MKSGSLRRIAEGLSTKVGYKVFRTTKVFPKQRQYRYGDLKDKIYQYNFFREQNLPALEFSTDVEVARGWASSGHVVVCRKLLRSSEGKGIVIAETPEQVVPAPVYTQYKKKKREFRVHVFGDKVLRVVEKLKRKDWPEERETKIRNTANGYVFCEPKGPIPDGVEALAIKASKVSTSHFKGVDIGYNEKQDQLFVIEVNSAPGIEGSNVDKYVEEILKHV